MTRPTFEVRLRIARTNAGMRQRDLAIAADLPESVVSLYETGRRRPSLDALYRLSGALGVSADYLLGLSSSMRPEAAE